MEMILPVHCVDPLYRLSTFCLSNGYTASLANGHCTWWRMPIGSENMNKKLPRSSSPNLYKTSVFPDAIQGICCNTCHQSTEEEASDAVSIKDYGGMF